MMPTWWTRQRGFASRTKPPYQRLETLAKGKGWRLPADNPQRASTFRTAGEARTAANFIVSQIATHEATIAQFRAQLERQGRRAAQTCIARDVAWLSRESPPALASGFLRMLSDNAAFAASPCTTHAGAFQPSTARRPTAGWLAMRDACCPCTEQPSPQFMRAFPMARPSARSRVAGTTRRDPIAPTACGRSPRATGVCSLSLRWHSTQSTPDRELAAVRELTDMLFDRVICRRQRHGGGIRCARDHRGRRSGHRCRGLRADQPRERGLLHCGGANPSRGAGGTHSARHAAATCEARRRAATRGRNALVEPTDADAGHVDGVRRRAAGARPHAAPPRSLAQVISSHQFWEVECPNPSQASRCKAIPAR